MRSSVIMATYNGENYLVEQLDSIRCQTLKPDEVIICDDHSSDNTCTIIEEYIHNYKLTNWFLYKNKENIGFFNNFFKALHLCNGDIIFLSDQDDIWDLNKLRSFIGLFLNEPKLSMIQSDFVFIDENGKKTNKQENYHGFSGGNMHELSIHDMCKYAGSGYTMSFRRNVISKIFDMKLESMNNVFQFHDIIIGLMAVSVGECLLCRNIVDKHRIHYNNVTKRKDKSYTSGRTKENHIDILNKRAQYFRIFATITTVTEKEKIFQEFSSFSMIRKEFVENFSFKKFMYLLKKRNMYNSKVGIFVDTFYSIGLEQVVNFFIE